MEIHGVSIILLKFNYFIDSTGVFSLVALLPFLSLLILFFYFSSGLIVPEKDSNETVPEVVATSGYALLHFFSDAAYNLTGFNITYK